MNLEMILFDRNPGSPKYWLDPLQRRVAREGGDLRLVEVQTGPPDWAGFVRAVTGSTAEIVILVMHGWSGGYISPDDADPDPRPVREVFPSGSISSPTLLLFCCHQAGAQGSWRRAAPEARLALHGGTQVKSVANIAGYLMRSHAHPSRLKLPRDWVVDTPGRSGP